jgi:hypothetical protein
VATEKSSAEDAKTLNDSKDSAPEGSETSAAKSKGSKPGVDEIRTRPYEIFQERQGGPGSEIGDWQEAEASASADAPKGVQTPADTGTI